ncbi:MAG: hypothetical protein ACR2PK_10820, partial [Acidimicrobiales bacterium]
MNTEVESIEQLGYPLGFKVEEGSARPRVLGTSSARDVIKVEARRLEGHQKEGVVSEGEGGSSWRVTTDEDGHLRGTDLAPFPLGYFNAGLHGDLSNRIVSLAHQRSIDVSGMTLSLDTGYFMTGSFFKGTGEGYAEPAVIDVTFANTSPLPDLQKLVADAVDASPALALMRRPLRNRFAIYVNGRRRNVTTMLQSGPDDAPDPYVTYSRAPAPLAATETFPDLIYKTGEKSEGVPEIAPGDMSTPQIRPVIGRSRLIDDAGATETDVVLGMPGASNFALKSDERLESDMAPSGLALLSAGVGFCYMTQLSRYIEYQKLAIRGVRLVQYTPYTLAVDDGGIRGGAEPADTHLFLSGDEDDSTFEHLMKIAERTCYLHK